MAFTKIMSVLLLATILSIEGAKHCSRESDFKDVCNSLCKCETKEGIVDLTPLQDMNLTAESALHFATFEFNPCTKFSTVYGCTDVLMCEHFKVVGGDKPVAEPSHAKFSMCGDGLVLRYSAQKPQVKSADVYLTCDKTGESNGTLYYLREPRLNHYEFELESKFACMTSLKTSANPGSTTPISSSKPAAKSTTVKTSPKPPTKTSPKTTGPTKPTTKPSPKPTTKPTNPTKPTTKPSSPTKPTTKPTHPTTNPTKPTKPTKSTNPTTKPTKPTNPTTKPTNPSKPTTKPTKPTTPPQTSPTKPTLPPTTTHGGVGTTSSSLSMAVMVCLAAAVKWML